MAKRLREVEPDPSASQVSVVHDAELLRQLVSWVGAGRVVLGSDYPYGMGTLDPVGFVRSAGLESADLETILGASPGAPVSEPQA
ncbi:MAG TPA: hypothetical protein VND96_06910 [Candidatus Micrarchaeaceae archaeon]|nr:hypothetical protein [Candidatus Micrarchaeaceae archaeon]